MTTNNRLNQISEYIDNIKKTAYLDIENIENLALSKNPNGDLVKNYISRLNSNKLTKIFIVKQIIAFYIDPADISVGVVRIYEAVIGQWRLRTRWTKISPNKAACLSYGIGRCFELRAETFILIVW